MESEAFKVLFPKRKRDRKLNTHQGNETGHFQFFKTFGLKNGTDERNELYRRHVSCLQQFINSLNHEEALEIWKKLKVFIEECTFSSTNTDTSGVAILKTGIPKVEFDPVLHELENFLKGITPFIARVDISNSASVTLAFQSICKQLMRGNINVSQFNGTKLIASKSEEDEETSDSEGTVDKYFSLSDLKAWYRSKTSGISSIEPSIVRRKSIKAKRISPYYPNSCHCGKGSLSPKVRVLRSPCACPKMHSNTSRIKFEPLDSPIAKTGFQTSNIIRTPKIKGKRPDRPFVFGNESLLFQSTPKAPSKSDVRKGSFNLTAQAESQCPLIIIFEDVSVMVPKKLKELVELISASGLPTIYLFVLRMPLFSCWYWLPEFSSVRFKCKEILGSLPEKRLEKFLAKMIFSFEFPVLPSSNVIEYLKEVYFMNELSLTKLLNSYKYETMALEKDAIVSSSAFVASSWIILFRIFVTISDQLQSFSLENFGKIWEVAKSFLDAKEEEKLLCKFERIIAILKSSSVTFYTDLLDSLGLELINTIESCQSHPFGSFIEIEIREILKIFDDFSEKLENLDKKEASESPKKIVQPFTNTTQSLNNVDQRQEFLNRLKQRVESCKPAKEVKFQKVRVEIVNFFEKLRRKHMNISQSFSEKRLEEHICDNVELLLASFAPYPELSFHKVLSRPEKHLKWKSKDPFPKLPDACILYQLIQEHMNHNINLSSLYQSFINTSEEQPAKKSDNGRNLILSRFIQAVNELHHIGIVRRKVRNMDEIVRLSWITEDFATGSW